jgi:hypothetical protein
MQGNSGEDPIQFADSDLPKMKMRRNQWARFGFQWTDIVSKMVESIRKINSLIQNIRMDQRKWGRPKSATESQDASQNREISFSFLSRVGWKVLTNGKDRKKHRCKRPKLLKVCCNKSVNCFGIRWSCRSQWRNGPKKLANS